MKLKQLITALSLGFAAISASATPLDSVTGNVNIKLAGLTTERNTYGADAAGTYKESTWGIGNVTEITGTRGQRWVSGLSDGTYLYYMIYGIADQNIIYDEASGKYSIYNVGATAGTKADGMIHMDLYRSTVNLLEVTSDFNANPALRTDFDQYSLFAGMTPYLKLTMGTGKQTLNVSCPTYSAAVPAGVPPCDPTADETQATLVQTTNAATLPAAGLGQFFADVIGGNAAAQWNTNGQFGHDFNGAFTLSTNGEENGHGSCPVANVLAGQCFTGFVNDPIDARKLPEPGSLALLGLGFAGLAGLRRRRAAK